MRLSYVLSPTGSQESTKVRCKEHGLGWYCHSALSYKQQDMTVRYDVQVRGMPLNPNHVC